MARNLDPKCKQCRRAGEKLFLKGERCFSSKCAMTKRNFPPGIHGAKGYGRRLTDYGQHLKEKQKLSRIYSVMERQLRKYFKEAVKSSEASGGQLLSLLERRLDNVIFRMGLANSRTQARQFVSHDLFKVNNKKINIPSYRVKAGDIITIRKEKSTKKGLLAENLKNIDKQEKTDWLDWSSKDNQGKIIELPQGDKIDIGVDMQMVVEFYS